MKLNLNVLPTLAAYDVLAERMGSRMDYVTKLVHDYVLKSGFIDTQAKKILKAVTKIEAANDELLLATFIGKLRHKLPALRMGAQLHAYDMKRAELTAAGLITHILMDNGSLTFDKRVESTTVDGHKKFHNRVYIQLGGSSDSDLLRGISAKPGVVNQKEVNGWKLKAIEKAFLRRVSSVPFVVSDYCDKELLMKGYSLKVDWNKTKDKNGRVMPEDPICRRRRYDMYADIIMGEVKAMPAIYFPAKYCGRDRVYYEAARLDGMRPHGKLWETLMIDSAVPFYLTEEDGRVLNHIIYVTLHGRVSIEKANELITVEDHIHAEMIRPLDQTDEAAFGEAILLNKCAIALGQYRDGELSTFMFGYDFTNSGLLMSGVSFKSEKMMKAGNIGGEEDVVDSHTAFGAGYDLDLDRDGIKKVHMGLMHGSALSTIANTITELTGAEVSSDDVRAFNDKAYGPEANNIPFIAEWGSKIIGNDQTELRWTMPDGFSCASRAYYKSVPVEIYCASAGHKEGYSAQVIVSDMPWLEDKKGFPFFGKETVVRGTKYTVEQKRRGLFANITHGNDSYALRVIGNAVLDSGRPILFKHDDFITPPSAVQIVEMAAKSVFSEMFEVNFYQMAMDEIVENSPYNLEYVELTVGNGPNTIWESDNFLMP